MRLLLDTHAVLWWFNGNERLSRPARAAVDDEDTDVFVSAVSAFEIALKHRSGRLPEAARLMVSYENMLANEGFTPSRFRRNMLLRLARCPFPTVIHLTGC